MKLSPPTSSPPTPQSRPIFPPPPCDTRTRPSDGYPPRRAAKADKVRSDGETSDARSGSDKDSSEKPEHRKGNKITAPGEPAVLPPRAFLPGNSEQSGADRSRGGACQ